MITNPDHGFGNLPEEYERYNNAAITIIPVSYDETSTWKKGSRFGPGAIITASGHRQKYRQVVLGPRVQPDRLLWFANSGH